MIEAVLFDYGLVLTGPPHEPAWAAMLAVMGLEDAAFRKAYWAPRHGYDRGTLTGEAYWQAVAADAGRTLTAGQVEALIEADTELWTQPNQPMIDWAARLQGAGTRTGILSNLGDRMTDGVMRKLPWMSDFAHRTFSHALKLAKPEADIYRHAVRGLGVAAEAILFVDDREENIAGAEAAGMQVIRYGDHDSFVAEMTARGFEKLWLTGALESR